MIFKLFLLICVFVNSNQLIKAQKVNVNETETDYDNSNNNNNNNNNNNETETETSNSIPYDSYTTVGPINENTMAVVDSEVVVEVEEVVVVMADNETETETSNSIPLATKHYYMNKIQIITNPHALCITVKIKISIKIIAYTIIYI